jgi:hypothetical protein
MFRISWAAIGAVAAIIILSLSLYTFVTDITKPPPAPQIDIKLKAEYGWINDYDKTYHTRGGPPDRYPEIFRIEVRNLGDASEYNLTVWIRVEPNDVCDFQSYEVLRELVLYEKPHSSRYTFDVIEPNSFYIIRVWVDFFPSIWEARFQEGNEPMILVGIQKSGQNEQEILRYKIML